MSQTRRDGGGRGSTGEIFDPGMQPERTLLSWNRTALAFTVAGSVGARMVAHLSIYLGIALLCLTIFTAVFVVYRAQRRYRKFNQRFQLPGSGPSMVLVTLLSLIIGLVAAGFWGMNAFSPGLMSRAYLFAGGSYLG